MLHEQGMLVAPWGSATQHKSLRCSRPCIVLPCLPFLEERGKPGPLRLSLWAELLPWWPLSLILGLPQLGPAGELLKGCHLFPFAQGLPGRAGKRGVLSSQRGSVGLSRREGCPPDFWP